MFRKNGIQKSRHVVLVIKTTNLHDYKPELGDRITQIACVEMINGKLTNNNFHTFCKIDDSDLLAHCAENYRANLTHEDATELYGNISNAPSFRDTQRDLFAYLAQDPQTKIIVHVKKHVLDFLRQALDEEGNKLLLTFKMENMISKAAKLAHDGKYHGGRYPDKVENDRASLKTTRAFYKMEDICKEFGVSTRLRSGYCAVQDAGFLARAEHNRIQFTVNSKQAALDQQPALRK